MTVLEGKWDCAQCRLKGISAVTYDKCPRCGDPRNENLDPSESDYLTEDAREITDPKDLKAIAAGPDWSCGKCGALNPDTAEVCECGDPRNWNDTVNQVVVYDDTPEEGAALGTPSQLKDDWVDAVLARDDKLQELADGPVALPTRTLRSSDIPRTGVSPYTGNERPQDVVHPRDGGWKTRVLNRRPAGLRSLGKIVVAGLIVLLLVVAVAKGGSWYYATHIKTQTVDLTIKGLWWERSVDVDESRTFTKEDWSIPPGGRKIGEERAVKSYNKVIDHYDEKTRTVYDKVKTGSHEEEDKSNCKTVKNGNGTYTKTCAKKTVIDYGKVPREERYKEPVYRNDPVYATKYTYQIDQWVFERHERASGKTDPYWPDPHLRSSRERVSGRFELYRVTLVDAQGRTAEKTTDQSTWSHLAEGQVVRGEQAHSGDVREVHWP